jgi:hypothetical protein
MAVSTIDIAWLAGLLEGEACFCVCDRRVKDKTYKRIYIQLVMTDQDVVERAANLLGTSAKPMPWRNNGMTKPTWRAYLCGDKAAGWMMTLYKLLGHRRQAKIRECLSAWKASPGRTKLQRNVVKGQEVA